MNYSNLKTQEIIAKVYENTRQEISGKEMQEVLLALVTSLGKGYQFMGEAKPEVEYGNPDERVFYIAIDNGTYVDNIIVDNEIAFILFDTEWKKISIPKGSEVTKEYVDNKVASEESRAQVVEASLEVAISTEQQRAEGAESALSQRIDTIIQGRNVRDIVGNHAELLSYDTSSLGDNDIIMVLLDETMSGHTTYYRWNLNESTWEFIGGLAFTYTKTEIDDKFRALHIVLPSISSDVVEHPENYQELLAQIDTMVRGAGADASFKMPVESVGNVDITFVKTNPAHIYLGIFADDRSVLYTINRTTSQPRSYSVEIVTKEFVTRDEFDAYSEGVAQELDGLSLKVGNIEEQIGDINAILETI